MNLAARTLNPEVLTTGSPGGVLDEGAQVAVGALIVKGPGTIQALVRVVEDPVQRGRHLNDFYLILKSDKTGQITSSLLEGWGGEKDKIAVEGSQRMTYRGSIVIK